ncbi:MAG TPA: hypothetical protein VFI47_03275 [Acidimicrobiales bacterium]|nr:hypothetical protein [Acidimicrobiales bacterium]
MGTTTSSRRHLAEIADPWLSTTVTFPAGRIGPPGMVNGGWVSGTVAGHLGRGPVEVTLQAPTPPGVPLDLRVADDRATLGVDGTVLVAARRAPGPLRAPAPVEPGEARAAVAGFGGWTEHPFPGCFVCGTDRLPHDGLRIFPGPVAGPPAAGGRPARVAAAFRPHPALAGPDGLLPPEAGWAALDCPTAWVHMRPGGVALLGRLRAEVPGRLRAGETYQVVAERAGTDGRKAYGRGAIYDGGGRLVGASEAVWISVA